MLRKLRVLSETQSVIPYEPITDHIPSLQTNQKAVILPKGVSHIAHAMSSTPFSYVHAGHATPADTTDWLLEGGAGAGDESESELPPRSVPPNAWPSVRLCFFAAGSSSQSVRIVISSLSSLRSSRSLERIPSESIVAALSSISLP